MAAAAEAAGERALRMRGFEARLSRAQQQQEQEQQQQEEEEPQEQQQDLGPAHHEKKEAAAADSDGGGRRTTAAAVNPFANPAAAAARAQVGERGRGGAGQARPQGGNASDV
eukprot:COSAG01_NODE_4948_length_4597_cov_3.418853_3_plen_112_part_00